MKNIFTKLLYIFAFILVFALKAVAISDLGITSVVYDNSSAVLTLNSFMNGEYEFTQKPKLYVLPEEHKAYFDINSAHLKCPKQEFKITSSQVNNIVVSQFSANPNIVRVVINYNEGYNPDNIQLRKLNNTIFIRFGFPVINNYYFSEVYSDNLKSDFFQPVSIKTVLALADTSFVSQINSAFSGSDYVDNRNFVLASKDLLLKSKYYIDNINLKNNLPVISGIGAYTLSKPMYLTNPNRVAYDVHNTVVNPILRNKEMNFNQTDSIKIGQFDKNTARIVITSNNPEKYIPVLYGDSQRLVFIDKVEYYQPYLATIDADLNNVLYEKINNNTQGLKLFFSKPVVYGIKRTQNSVELIFYNVINYSESTIKSVLSNSDFSNTKITPVQKGCVKFDIPIDNGSVIDVLIGSDGKTLRLKKIDKVVNNANEVKEPVKEVKPKSEHNSFFPILIPKKVEKERVIVIDPGHGGSDVGATRDDIYEKDITLDVSNRVVELLRKKGYTVRMTRISDETVSLQERVEISENANPDIFVSIHVNSSNSDGPSGLETHYYKDNSLDLAKNVHASLLNHVNTNDRGLFKSKFYVINHTTAPAILVEIGFLSNPIERAELLTEERKQATAKAIAEGIYGYFK